MFVPRHPETMSSLAAAEKAEAALDSERLISSAVSAATRETISAEFITPLDGTVKGV